MLREKVKKRLLVTTALDLFHASSLDSPSRKAEVARISQHLGIRLSRTESVDDLYDMRKQGDIHMYTSQKVKERLEIMKAPVLLHAINCLFDLATHSRSSMERGGEGIGEEEYIQLHIRIQKALIPVWNEAEAMALAREEWHKDLSLDKYSTNFMLSKEGFIYAMWELSDMWTETTDPQHYADFLWKIVDSVSNGEGKELGPLSAVCQNEDIEAPSAASPKAVIPRGEGAVEPSLVLSPKSAQRSHHQGSTILSPKFNRELLSPKHKNVEGSFDRKISHLDLGLPSPPPLHGGDDPSIYEGAIHNTRLLLPSSRSGSINTASDGGGNLTRTFSFTQAAINLGNKLLGRKPSVETMVASPPASPLHFSSSIAPSTASSPHGLRSVNSAVSLLRRLSGRFSVKEGTGRESEEAVTTLRKDTSDDGVVHAPTPVTVSKGELGKAILADYLNASTTSSTTTSTSTLSQHIRGKGAIDPLRSPRNGHNSAFHFIAEDESQQPSPLRQGLGEGKLPLSPRNGRSGYKAQLCFEPTIEHSYKPDYFRAGKVIVGGSLGLVGGGEEEKEGGLLTGRKVETKTSEDAFYKVDEVSSQILPTRVGEAVFNVKLPSIPHRKDSNISSSTSPPFKTSGFRGKGGSYTVSSLSAIEKVDEGKRRSSTSNPPSSMSSPPSPPPSTGGLSHQYVGMGGMPLPEKVLTLPLEEKARGTAADAPKLRPLEGAKKAAPPISSAPVPPAKVSTGSSGTRSALPNLLEDILSMKNPPPAKEKGAGIPVSKRLNPNQGIIRF